MFWFTDTTEKLEVGGGNDHFRLTRKDWFCFLLPTEQSGQKNLLPVTKLLFTFRLCALF